MDKLFFSILPKGEDPDDYVKKNGKESFLEILRNKLSIEDFIWDYCISGLNFSDTYALSNFEKKIKSIYSTIQDSTLKKYINEKLLDKLKTLTPNQKFNFKGYRTKTKLTFLNDTKKIFKQKKDISRNDILEFNILFIMIFNSEIIEDKINVLQNIIFYYQYPYRYLLYPQQYNLKMFRHYFHINLYIHLKHNNL